MPKYELTEEDRARLYGDYSFHPPFGDQAARHSLLRNKGRELAELIHELCPPSRERSVSLSALNAQVIMNAIEAITRNEERPRVPGDSVLGDPSKE